ncbi:Ccc1p NDAI_0C04920 [Naumovozyma dairenensis CBS 421]|uniref:Protein CCC1 n=1 Tax=Naumovozyma dairenensis (strain ATCC 10597 / BCRC 20456 / CBS 421 / NBRC 0211 / NRRL Y-12639) TaxID=1071378 RepID=G0W8P0_NAUDC|nr:hypothetical protein NDAI_0C04920 [Naumovozyma dairenensis CBS 421]CCD24151.1 hypothetical protein NDAI_0C04920 [Naumovozyma dairenensis CBS 421]
MSIVALKNAVVKVISSNADNKNNTQQQQTQNTSSYGSITTNNDNNNNNSNNLGQQPDLEQGLSPSTKSLNYDVDSSRSSNNNDSNVGIFDSLDPRMISDLIIGLSDGLTVPFALTAGLSSLGDSKLVITGGFAELISGAISMGLGGYLGAKSESDYYHAEVKQERRKIFENQNLIYHEVEDILIQINPDFSEETILSFIKDLQSNPDLMLDFVVRYGKGLEEPAENRQFISAMTIGGGYLIGGFVPLFPYFFVTSVHQGLIYSIIVMAVTLFLFGYFKAQISMGDVSTFPRKIGEGVEMMTVGGVAAAAAWFFVKLLG